MRIPLSANLSAGEGERGPVAARAEGVDNRCTNTRGRVLAVAPWTCSPTRGYQVTSLREIAERLDVTKAALYFHLRTKQEILTALLRGCTDGVASLASDAMAKQPLPLADQEELLRRIPGTVGLRLRPARTSELRRDPRPADRDRGSRGHPVAGTASSGRVRRR